MAGGSLKEYLCINGNLLVQTINEQSRQKQFSNGYTTYRGQIYIYCFCLGI